MSLLICCAVFFPLVTLGEQLSGAEIGDEETFIEHDAVTGKDTVFTLADLNMSYSVNSFGSVSENDSASGVFYTLPTEPEGAQVQLQESSDDEVSPPSVLPGRPYSRVSDVTQTPYCKNTLIVCYRDLGNGVRSYSYGTGYMVGHRVMVTAGHCIWSEKYRSYPTQIRIFPRYDQYRSDPKTILNETDFYYAKVWVLSSNFAVAEGNPDDNYDWCYLTLFSPIGKTITGTYGIAWKQGSIENKEIILSGYLHDEKDHPNEIFHQYESNGIMNSISGYRVRHNCSTRAGHSGSALSSVNYVSWGIHTAGATSYNEGVRFTSTLYNLIINKINSTNDT